MLLALTVGCLAQASTPATCPEANYQEALQGLSWWPTTTEMPEVLDFRMVVPPNVPLSEEAVCNAEL